MVWPSFNLDLKLFPGLAADARLRGVFDKKQMERVVGQGLRCSDPDVNKRPTMHDAIVGF